MAKTPAKCRGLRMGIGVRFVQKAHRSEALAPSQIRCLLAFDIFRQNLVLAYKLRDSRTGRDRQSRDSRDNIVDPYRCSRIAIACDSGDTVDR